jgi:HK97 family phage major capsid protein
MPAPVQDIPALKAQIKATVDEATQLMAPDSSAEDKEKGVKLLESIDVQKRELVNLEKLEGYKKEFATQANAANGNGNGETPVDRKAGEIVTDAAYKPQGSKFDNFNRYLRAVYLADKTHQVDTRLAYHEDDPVSGEAKVMVEGVGASGGFLVPPEQQQTTLAVDAPEAIVRPRATVIRMNRRQFNVPVIDQTVGATGVAPWFGGLQVYWTEETGVKTASDMGFKEITLVAHKMTLRTLVSTELLDDSMVSVSDLLMGPRGFGGAIPWTEEYSFMRGTGAGQPRGIIGAGATIVVPRQTQGHIVLDDIVNMYQNFLPSGNGIWIAAQNTISDLLLMNGPAGNASYVFMPSARDGMPNYLMGMPLFFSDKSPRMANGAVGDIMLCDWSYYLIGDRQATTLASSAHEYFSYNKVVFRAEHRIDGQPWLSAPITYENGTDQVSPFVVLGSKTT